MACRDSASFGPGEHIGIYRSRPAKDEMRFVVRLPPITKLLQLIPSMVDEYPVNMALKRLGSHRIELIGLKGSRYTFG